MRCPDRIKKKRVAYFGDTIVFFIFTRYAASINQTIHIIDIKTTQFKKLDHKPYCMKSPGSVLFHCFSSSVRLHGHKTPIISDFTAISGRDSGWTDREAPLTISKHPTPKPNTGWVMKPRRTLKPSSGMQRQMRTKPGSRQIYGWLLSPRQAKAMLL